MNAVTLDRVTLRGPRALPPRKRALRRLERIDPSLPGAPSEILVVRSLPDPAPGMLARMDDARVLSKWEAAAAASLSTVRDRAHRLRPGEDGASAEALVFADEAEMIACIAERRAAGRAPGWWARALLRRLQPGASAGVILAQQPHLVVPVFSILIARGTAVDVVSKLTETELNLLADIIGMPRHTPLSDDPLPHYTVAAQPAAAQTPTTVPPVFRNTLVRLAPQPAILLAAIWVKQGCREVGPEVLEQKAHAIVRLCGSTQPPPVPPPETKQPDAAREREITTAPVSHPTAQPNRERIGRPTEPPAQQTENPAGKLIPRETAAPADPNSPTPIPERPAKQEVLHEAALPEGLEHLEAPPSEGINTFLGGIPFLVNLYAPAIRLRAPDLAAALDEAARDEDGKWTALERLARALLPDGTEVESDPIWPVLSDLDGRSDGGVAQPDERDLSAARACADWLETMLGDDAERFADLLKAPAKLFVTPVHLDVVLPARAQNTNARRAGLDLDPGWQPKFGRIIAFHYSEDGRDR